MNVTCQEDCGNAPKKLLLRDFTVAFVNHDVTFMMEQVSDEIVWDRVGGKKVVGKDQFSDVLQHLEAIPISEIEIRHIITHGRTGSVNGITRYGKGCRSFCYVYLFNSAGKNAKIKEITSYVIELT